MHTLGIALVSLQAWLILLYFFFYTLGQKRKNSECV